MSLFDFLKRREPEKTEDQYKRELRALETEYDKYRRDELNRVNVFRGSKPILNYSKRQIQEKIRDFLPRDGDRYLRHEDLIHKETERRNFEDALKIIVLREKTHEFFVKIFELIREMKQKNYKYTITSQYLKNDLPKDI